MIEETLDAVCKMLDMCSDIALLVNAQDHRIVWANRAYHSWLEMSFGRTQEQVPSGPASDSALVAEEMGRIGKWSDAESTRCSIQIEIPAKGIRQEIHNVKRGWISFGVDQLVALVIENRQSLQEHPASSVQRRDPLTGLPNRSVLMDRLEELIHGKRAADQDFAVLFIDLDDFKTVNDSWGHRVGDEVLEEAAHRMAHCVRHGDVLVRYGGDEFVALLEQVSSDHEYLPVVERLHTALQEPIQTHAGISVTVSASVGATDSRSHQGSAFDFLDAADRAMYRAKHQRATAG